MAKLAHTGSRRGGQPTIHCAECGRPVNRLQAYRTGIGAICRRCLSAGRES